MNIFLSIRLFLLLCFKIIFKNSINIAKNIYSSCIQTSNLRGNVRDEKINIYKYFLGNMISLYLDVILQICIQISSFYIKAIIWFANRCVQITQKP